MNQVEYGGVEHAVAPADGLDDGVTHEGGIAYQDQILVQPQLLGRPPREPPPELQSGDYRREGADGDHQQLEAGPQGLRRKILVHGAQDHGGQGDADHQIVGALIEGLRQLEPPLSQPTQEQDQHQGQKFFSEFPHGGLLSARQKARGAPLAFQRPERNQFFFAFFRMSKTTAAMMMMPLQTCWR